MLHALTRSPGPRLAECTLSFLPRRPIDAARAADEHRAYVAALASLGLEVEVLPAAPGLPDATFVEDPVLVLDEVALLLRSAVVRRQGEADLLAPALARHRPVERLAGSGSIDGGDVLRAGRVLYVGLSRRSDRAGIESLRRQVEPHGYRVESVPIDGCLHLKTAATFAAPDLLLANPRWVDPAAFTGCDVRPVPDGEPWAANVLAAGAGVLVPAAHPRTAELLARRGLAVVTTGLQELQKAEAGPTCLALVFPCDPPAGELSGTL